MLTLMISKLSEDQVDGLLEVHCGLHYQPPEARLLLATKMPPKWLVVLILNNKES